MSRGVFHREGPCSWRVSSGGRVIPGFSCDGEIALRVGDKGFDLSAGVRRHLSSTSIHKSPRVSESSTLNAISFLQPESQTTPLCVIEP